jgi:hypothetical protein
MAQQQQPQVDQTSSVLKRQPNFLGVFFDTNNFLLRLYVA